MKINKIAHFADIHIMNKLATHEECKQAIDKALFELKKQEIDLIIVVGDLFHDNLDTNNEAETIAGYFLNNLAKIARVIITQGNHDINKNNPERLDSIQNIVNLIDNNNITYLNKTSIIQDVVDKSVMFAVWHHIDKQSPWSDEYVKDSNKFYIDLFHDPVNGCLAENSQKMEATHYRNLSDFKGDIAMFGDIHKQQDFHKNGKLFACYSSSLYETKYSEGDNNFHGFVVWDINDRNNPVIEKIKIETEFSHHNLTIREDFDYSNILLELNEDNLTNYSRLFVKWYCYSSDNNSQNYQAIRYYIKSKYPKIKEIKTERFPIHINSVSSKEQELLDNINDKEIQKKVYVEYLTENGYDEKIIDDVLKIDNDINGLLDVSVFENVINNIKIKSFGFHYFRSYGENNEIVWDSKNGIYQIKGGNRGGKSTIMHFIMYMLFGTTPSKTKEKNSDNIFINDRLDVDFTGGYMYIEINNELYIIDKKTERKYNRQKTEIAGVSTTIKYTKVGEEDNEEIDNKTEKNTNKTQQLIEKSIGSYDDFIRKVYTDADNLNKLLSNDKSDFIDNILYDTGLDIFDKKLEAYKKYKKIDSAPKIVLNVQDENDKIAEKEAIIKEYEATIEKHNSEVEVLDDRLKKGQEFKDSELKKLHNIDSKISNINIEEVDKEISNLEKDIETKKLEQKQKQDIIETLPNNFDDEKYNNVKSRLDKFKDWEKEQISVINNNNIIVSKNENSIKEYEQSTFSIKNEIESVNKDILNVTINKINVIDNSISKLNSSILLLNKDIESLKKDISIFEYDKKTINNNILTTIKNIESEIKVLEDSKVCDDKSCPTCNRKYEDENIIFIDKTISEKKELIDLNNKKLNNNEDLLLIDSKISDKNSIIVSKTNEIVLNESGIKDLENLKLNIDNDADVISEQNLLKIKIEDLNNKIKVNDAQILILKSDINVCLETIKSLNSDIKNKENENKNDITLLNELETIKSNFDKRKILILENNNLPIIIENNLMKIDKLKRDKKDYSDVIVKIEENKVIDGRVLNINAKLKVLDTEKQEILVSINKIRDVLIVETNKEIETINERISKYLIQEHKINVDKAYMQCIHRDGLPTTLLKKMIPNINSEFEKLLCDAPFKLFFDDDINLKMGSVKYNSFKNVLNGSGMERTFVSMALKITLMKISNKCRYNILLLDEITNKIDAEYMILFKNLLEKMKSIIDVIVIIDHYNEFNSDYIIKVSNNDDEISSLEIC